MDRRIFTAGLAGVAGTLGTSLANEDQSAPFRGKAEHVISIWLGGGMGALDTFDPKRVGDPASKKAGSYYPSIPTAVSEVRVCEHLAGLAPLMDRVTVVRTVNHTVIDEHAAATNRMHTGRPVGGSTQYPSLGSVVAHEKGALAGGIPPYVVIGYPNVTRGPGFLGPKAGYIYLTDTSQGPAGLSRPELITQPRQNRRNDLLGKLREAGAAERTGKVREYDETIGQLGRLGGPEFLSAFQMDGESAEMRRNYGSEFGQRCLLARRLVERGVRFIEVSHNLNFLNGAGWDVHNEGIKDQHLLIRELDFAFSTLIKDLEKRRLLDKTLLVITTEFGRPPEFDSGGGRGHQAAAFSCVLAGGGLRHRGAWGATDEAGKKIIQDPVGVPDLFATIYACLGMDTGKNLMDGERPVPLTDMGKPVGALFA